MPPSTRKLSCRFSSTWYTLKNLWNGLLIML
jgi:hypothetical protein